MADDNKDRLDPARSMRLLWGLVESAGRGPKQKLSAADIVTAAIEIADADGLDAVSMRRVADRLGVGVMTLYTYFQARSEIIDLMFDRVVGEIELVYAVGSNWRQKLELIARANWSLRHRHRWIQEISWSRTPLGPNALDAYETSMSSVRGLGLNGKQMAEVLNLVAAYVAGAARNALESVSVSAETGVSDTEWWEAVSPILDQVWDPQRFPTLSSPEMAGAFDQPDDDDRYFLAEALSSFEFGLSRVLDGIEAFLESQTPRNLAP